MRKRLARKMDGKKNRKTKTLFFIIKKRDEKREKRKQRMEQKQYGLNF